MNQIKLKNNEYTETDIQENKDAQKLGHLKMALKGKGRGKKCPDEVRDILDENLPGWRTEVDFDKKAMEYAISIVERANVRKQNGHNVIPQHCCTNKSKLKNNEYTETEIRENKDAQKLGLLKKALKRKGRGKCPDEVRDILDKNLLGWRTEADFDKKAMEYAISIVERANVRKQNGHNVIPRQCCRNKSKLKNNEYTETEIQEHKDDTKLRYFKTSLKGGRGKCPDEVRDYLDKHMPGWRPIYTTTVADTSAPKPKKTMKLKVQAIRDPVETAEHKRTRVKTELSTLHQRYKTMNSQNLGKEFAENPETWTKYHEISEENEKSFPEDGIPRNRIIRELDKIKTKREKIVVDMGCGKAQIAQHYANDSRFQFINYDHISSNETVTSCDILHTPLEDDSVEICVLSLAMWGSNCREYIREAKRILESNGRLYIIEATKRWSEQDERGNIIPGQEGIKMKTLLEENGFHVLEQEVEKFCVFTCIAK